jgi:hypothetical protein
MALQTFSPREIQARVRGGESAEVVAADTGWPLDKVLRYAEPLLAERAFIAEQAQSVEIRRSGGGANLVEAAHAALDSAGGAADRPALEWDAWRREDGKWIVSATYADRGGEHTAQWSYDHAGRNIHPLDDEARLLMGARPVAVPDPEVDIAEALDLVADIPVIREDSVEVRPHLVAVPDADDEADDLEGDEAEELELVAELDEAPGHEPVALFDEPAAPTHANETVAIAHPSSSDTSAPLAPTADRKAPARKPKARKGRASVPSWDEILFGATKSDD